MIPANIDVKAIMEDLNRWGIGDRKIEAICDFSDGYARHAKNGKFKEMGYHKVARLYNFWIEECLLHEVEIPWERITFRADNAPHLVATT